MGLEKFKGCMRSQIILACCVLYNMCISMNDQVPERSAALKRQVAAKKNCISHTISLYILFLIYSKEIKTITKHNGNTNTLHSYLDNESLLSHLSIWSCVSIVNPSPDSSLLGKSGNLSCSRNSLISFRCDSSRDWRLVISSSRSRIPASNWLT